MSNPISQEFTALKFTPGRQNPVAITLQVQSGEDLASLKAQACPAVYIVANDNLDRLGFYKDHVRLRHQKNKAKSLKDHLLDTGNPDDPRIPLIHGGHKSVGQFKRSIRTFLHHALNRNAGQIYFVGATPELLDQLRAHQNKTRDRSPAAMAVSTQEDIAWAHPMSEGKIARRLLELLPDIEVPQKLATYYIGSSIEAQVVRRLIMVAAGCDLPILILGESGTGKELVAQAIHDYSNRRGNFEPINCSTFPPDLLESELFGYEKDSHSQASQTKKGLWELAQDGTLFLDEIGDLPLAHQAKLLRALQENQIRRVGGTKSVSVNARIVCATNRDLFSMVRANRFREELYFRIRGLMIRTPSLRSHVNDIEDLAQSVWTRITNDRKNVLPRAILKALRQHSWPGNVRELKSVLEALHNLFGESGLTVEKLQLAASYLGGGVSLTSTAAGEDWMLAHRSECLRHLLRADEVVQACEVAIRSLIQPGNTTNKKRQGELHEALQYRLSELELLTLRPLLFHSEETYDAMSKFKSTFQSFCQQLEHEPTRAVEFWQTEGESSLKQVVSSLFAEVQRLLK